MSTEILPPFRHPCAGGGVRIWGLAEPLRKQGIRCTYFLHERIAAVNTPSADLPIRFFKPETLHHDIMHENCDALLIEQWQPLTFLKANLDIPVIVDLPGPLLLEYFWRDRDNYYQHTVDKVECLSRADYFLCAHERQRGYYTAWLAWAGIAPDADRLKTVPFNLHEMPRSRGGYIEDEPQFFWGGMFWPWQDRVSAFRSILHTLTRLRRGQLVIAGGNGETLPADGLRFDDYADHPHISWLGLLPFHEYILEIKRATVAIDLSRPTNERRLSSDLRTGTALWAGTPCLVTPESCWAQSIEKHNAGWVLPYNCESELCDLIRDIALERTDIVVKRRGAQEISQQISREDQLSPLLSILKNPTKRESSKPFFDARFVDRERRLQALQDEFHRLQHDHAALQHDLDSIRSKPLFRVYKQITSLIGKNRK
ncbi:MAG: hypothetical protein C4527_12490 [Candidatus Omnitrophota bacterium]|nr:MAG: hypothetical protein C4527_12490 [Candidatus Omnitrophota bacterium]